MPNQSSIEPDSFNITLRRCKALRAKYNQADSSHDLRAVYADMVKVKKLLFAIPPSSYGQAIEKLKVAICYGESPIPAINDEALIACVSDFDRLTASHKRAGFESAIEALIGLCDAMDGDSDIEDSDPVGGAIEDESQLCEFSHGYLPS